MMNNSKLFKFGCAVAITMLPPATQATTRTEGLNACAEALVAELGKSQSQAIDFSLAPESTTSIARLDRREVFHLDVSGPDGEVIVARADCTVNAKAEVVKMESLPLDSEDSVVRARQPLY